MIAFAERHVAITGAATSWFIGAVAMGGFGLPWLIGQLFDRTGSSAHADGRAVLGRGDPGLVIVVARLFARRSAIPAERVVPTRCSRRKASSSAARSCSSATAASSRRSCTISSWRT